jgi:hypothetical protein
MPLQDCSLENIRRESVAETEARNANDCSLLDKDESAKDFQDNPHAERNALILSLLRAFSAWPT